MKKQNFMVILTILIFLTFSFSPSQGLTGTDVWQEDGYIVYLYNFNIGYNRNYYSSTEFPDVSISEPLMTEYTGIRAGKMYFDSSFEDTSLNSQFGFDEEEKVDPDTGKDAEGQWTGRFYDTSNFQDGYIVDDFITTFGYSTGNATYTVQKKYEVSGDTVDTEYEINGVTQSIKVWDLTIEDFNLDYTYFWNDTTYLNFRNGNKDFIIRLSEKNGVLLSRWGRETLEGETSHPGEYVTLVEITTEIIAQEIVNVDVGQAPPGIPGFEYGMVVCAIISLIVVGFLTKRKHRN